MRVASPGRVARGRRAGFVGVALLIGTAGVIPLVAFAPSASASASVVSSTTPVTSVNLADYGLVARYPLPSKANPLGGDTSCTSGSGDVLADEASAVAYDPNGAGGAGSLFVLGDGGACVVQTTLTGTYIDSMTLASGNSAEGTAFYDTEGITYVGQDGGKPQLVMTEERYRQLDEFDYTAGTTLTLAEAEAVKLGTTIGNIGLEGVAYDPATSNASGCSSQTVGPVTGNFCQGFVVAKEKQPEDIFQTNVDWGSRGAQSTDPATGTATNGGPDANEGSAGAPTSLFPPSDANLNDFSDVFAMSNIASLDGTDPVSGADGSQYDGDLLIDSQESGAIELVDRSGNIKSRLDLLPNPSSGLDVVDETHEGVAMDQFGNLYVDSEDGAGQNAPELEVYAPTTDPDKSPTAITLASTKGTLPSTTTTANGPVKLSNLSVTDGDSDGIGTDVYTVAASDGDSHDVSGLFTADHTGLYVAPGASLANVPSPVSITVTVKDPGAVDASSFPNGVTSSPYALTITAHTPVTGAESKIIISEVDPSGSGAGNNSYGEDWFELTNTGTQPVDLTGWSADDSHEVAGKFPLLGVSTIGPGESVVFVQADTAVGATTTPTDTVAAFKSAWGLSSTAQVGWYSDEDGLSQSGDEVNVYDAGENFVTGVSFGASEDKVSFDNSAGITGPIDTFSDSGGDDGSFTDSEGETGSPDFAHIVASTPSVAITEVDPTGSSMSYAADWFELTNTGTSAVDLTGWKMDDSSDAIGSAVALGGVSSIPAGKSAVFFEDTSGTDATIETAFSQAWFGTSTLPSGFLIGHYGGSGVGLSTGGDAVNLFDASGNHVTGVTFGAASSTSPIATFDNTAGGSSVSTLSQVGVNGAFLSANGAEVGSPGTIATTSVPPPTPSVAITEVDPTGSSMSYAADWFELTNTGTSAVDLTGWKMDDSSDAIGSAVALGGVSSIPAGKSAVFFEDMSGTDATIETALSQAWFGTSTLPSGFLIGHYGGSGVGLSTGGDAVNLFDASGNHVTGVTFGAASSTSPIATFDNTAGGSSVSTLSQVGVNGAFLSANGAEVGSPGTIATTSVPTTITSADATTFTAKLGGTFTVSTSGHPTPTLTESGTLPSGVTFTDNGDGTATLAGTPTAAAPGTYPVTVTAANGTTPATQSFTLTVLGTAPTPTTADLTGAVTDASNGNPLASACVYLYQVGNTSSAAYASCTASNGDYEVDGITPGSYDVAFSALGGSYATQWFNGTATGATSQSGATALSLTGGKATTGIDAALASVPAGNLTGTVTDASTTHPLANVCVYLYAAGNTTSAAYATCTGSNGAYAFGGVTPGSYDVAFADPSGTYGTQWYTGSAGGAASQSGATVVTVPNGNGTLSGINAALTEATAGNLTGTVTDATTGHPVANVCVYLYPAGNTSQAAYATCTGSTGTYGFSGITPSGYNVAFADPSGTYATQWFNGTGAGVTSQAGASVVVVPAGNKTTSGINAALAEVPAGNLTGTVTEAVTATPLANVCVYLYPAGNTTSAAYATCTGSNGTYNLDGLTPGSYNVAFADPAGTHATQWYNATANGATTQSGATTVTVPGGNQTLSGINAVLSLVATGNVTGTVTDATTTGPVANVCVYLYQVGHTSSAAYATCTAPDGSYAFAGITPGFYDVAFSDPTGTYTTQWYTGTAAGASSQSGAQAISVTNGGATVSDVNAALGEVPSGNVTGTVTSAANGHPLANICVYLYQVNNSSSAADATCTAANGSYQLSGVTPGSYDVAFFDPSFTYATQWYTGTAAGAASQAGATAVTVPSGNGTLSGIAAALSAAS